PHSFPGPRDLEDKTLPPPATSPAPRHFAVRADPEANYRPDLPALRQVATALRACGGGQRRLHVLLERGRIRVPLRRLPGQGPEYDLVEPLVHGRLARRRREPAQRQL